MSGLFRANKANLALARAAVREYGQCWLHGCGNVYATEADSDFRKDFTNQKPDKSLSDSSYVLHFNNVSQIPTDLDRLEEMFLKSKVTEAKEKDRKKSVSKVKTITVTDEDSEDLKDDPQPVVVKTSVKPIQKAVLPNPKKPDVKATGPQKAVLPELKKEPVQDEDTGEGDDLDTLPDVPGDKKNKSKTAGSAGVVI